MPSEEWYLLSDDPVLGVRRYALDLDDERSVIRTEYYAVDAFMTANAEQYKASEGQRFGKGRMVASIPMHIWARQIAPRMRDGNIQSLKKWLNDFDNRCFRTFRGRV